MGGFCGVGRVFRIAMGIAFHKKVKTNDLLFF